MYFVKRKQKITFISFCLAREKFEGGKNSISPSEEIYISPFDEDF